MWRREELERYVQKRLADREVRAALAAGELYEWVGDDEAVEEDAKAAAVWLGDHIGHRVQVRVDVDPRAGTLWLVEGRQSAGGLVGWRIRVDDAVWPLASDARCLRWNRTYRAGDPAVSWPRAVLNASQADLDLPGWVSYWSIEDCTNDPAWLARDARLSD